MSLSDALQFRRRVLILAALLGSLAIAGLSSQLAHAAPASSARPFVGCAPCISSLDPAQNGTVTANVSGNVTIKFSAQLLNPFVRFVLTLDGTVIDNAKIQVTSNDPLQPTGQYTAALGAGKHTAMVEVDDTSGSAAAFPGWTFTVQAPPQTPIPTKTPASSSNGNGNNTGSNTGNSASNNSGNSSSVGLLSPKTLSIILFSIAGVGVIVMAFIAGMWYSGRRSFGGRP
ncbi:MAG TPA: Ig-like domain-containing protein [Ktedonobacterales bacterium]|jgi:hypothetical protein